MFSESSRALSWKRGHSAAFNVSLLLVVDLSLYFQTPVKDEKTGETKDKVTAFIVERGFGGVTRYYLKVTLPSFQVFSFLIIVDTTNFEIRLFDVTREDRKKLSSPSSSRNCDLRVPVRISDIPPRNY